MEHIYLNDNFGEKWFTYANFYSFIVKKFPSNSHFVEVGSWKGMSSAYMAVEIINSNKNIKFDCVDTWLGTVSDGHQQEHYVSSGKLYDLFIENMKPVEKYYTPIRLTSIEAAKLYKDKSLDFVFIDADHTYDAVKSDILSWLPKIKSGGVIGGHDYISRERNAFIGLKKAVHECFSFDQINDEEQDRVWWVQL